MPSTFTPSIAALTLGVLSREDVIDQPASPATVVDPRSRNDERNPIFLCDAQGPNKIAPFLARARADKPYTVLPGGRIMKRGAKPAMTAPALPPTVSLGHEAHINTGSGRHL